MQCASKILMVRPARPDANRETVASNAFQARSSTAGDRAAVIREFEASVSILRAAGVEVVVFEEPDSDPCPDSIFLNNWFSTSADESHILYPMLSPARRKERRPELLRYLSEHYPERTDLTFLEQSSHYLEGTGSLVLDRVARIAYAALSPRTTLAALDEWEERTGWSTIRFTTHGPGGIPAYHTNVIMAIGTSWAIVTPEVIDAADRPRVLDRLSQDREILEIRADQAERFAGNVLEIRGESGPIIAISRSAVNALDESQRLRLQKHGSFAICPIPTIEKLGGGSIRCMIAELF